MPRGRDDRGGDCSKIRFASQHQQQEQSKEHSNGRPAIMTIDIYPAIVHENDLSPDAFGPEIDEACEEIHDAVKGWGANKDAVIDALGAQDATNRYKISLRYKELYDKDLVQVMKKEFSGDFGAALQFLALPADKAEAKMIRKATAGIGASVDILYSITAGRTNAELQMLKKAYFDMYTKDLG